MSSLQLYTINIFGDPIIGGYPFDVSVNEFASAIVKNGWAPYRDLRKIKKVELMVETFDPSLVDTLSYHLVDMDRIYISDGCHRTLALLVKYVRDGLNIRFKVRLSCESRCRLNNFMEGKTGLNCPKD